MTDKTTSNFDLGDVGRQWIRQCLERSVCLGPLLLPELDMQEGKTVVLGIHGEPPHDDVGRLWESVSHLDVLDQHTSAAATLGLFKTLDSEGAAVIVENDLLLPHDKQTHEMLAAGSAVVASGKVFHIHEISSLIEDKDVIDALAEGIGHPLNAFIVRKDVACHFVDLVRGKAARQLADALLATVHTIYDNDGYAAWIRATGIE